MVINGKEIPVAFGHHTLDDKQRRYATNEREALAIVYFCEYWEKFLLGHRFTIRTDHQALTTLMKQYGNGRKSGKFARWFERLSVFDYAVIYRQGSQNTVADALSRLNNKASELGVSDPVASFVINAVNTIGLSVSTFQDASHKDPLQVKIKNALSTRWPAKNKMNPTMLPYFQLRNELSVENGYIVRDNYRILVPDSLRHRILKLAHAGHPGICRMKRKLRECYWWPGMDTEIELFVRHCLPCQDSLKSAPKVSMPPYIIPTPESAWDKVAIDITGPYANAPRNYRFNVVLIDYYSKFPEILCTSDTTSANIIRWLKDIFGRYGHPSTLVSDNGPQFISHAFEEFLQSNDIAHELSPAYHPQYNGLVERFNRYINHNIQTFNASRVVWLDGIRDLLLHFRATAPTPDGQSPGQLMFNRPIRLGYEIVRNRKGGGGDSLKSSMPTDTPGYIIPVTPNKRFSGPYKLGEKVRVKLPHVPKGSSPFSTPRTVIQVMGNWTYKLSDGFIWNARKLRHIYDNPPATYPHDNDQNPAVHPQVEPQQHRPVQPVPIIQPRRSTRPTRGIPPRRYSPG